MTLIHVSSGSSKHNLHDFDHDELMRELLEMTCWLQEQSVLEDIALDYRVKSMDSIELKYKRYYPNRQIRQVFNDILGFRSFCDNYPKIERKVSVHALTRQA
jgi:putative GTP pyrophosphokinase